MECIDERRVREIRTSYSSEASAELRTLLGAVGDELEVGSETLVVVGEPLNQRDGLLDLQVLPGLLVLEVLRVLLLVLVHVQHLLG